MWGMAVEVVRLRLGVKYQNIPQVYAPQRGCKEEKIEEFLEILGNQIDDAPIVVMGNLNAQDLMNMVNRTRKDFHRVIDFHRRNNLFLGNTWFRKKPSRKITRYGWVDRRTKTVIDYVLKEREYRRELIDVTAMPEEAFGGDHRAVVFKMQVGALKWAKEVRERRIKETSGKQSAHKKTVTLTQHLFQTQLYTISNLTRLSVIKCHSPWLNSHPLAPPNLTPDPDSLAPRSFDSLEPLQTMTSNDSPGSQWLTGTHFSPTFPLLYYHHHITLIIEKGALKARKEETAWECFFDCPQTHLRPPEHLHPGPLPTVARNERHLWEKQQIALNSSFIGRVTSWLSFKHINEINVNQSVLKEGRVQSKTLGCLKMEFSGYFLSGESSSGWKRIIKLRQIPRTPITAALQDLPYKLSLNNLCYENSLEQRSEWGTEASRGVGITCSSCFLDPFGHFPLTLPISCLAHLSRHLLWPAHSLEASLLQLDTTVKLDTILNGTLKQEKSLKSKSADFKVLQDMKKCKRKTCNKNELPKRAEMSKCMTINFHLRLRNREHMIQNNNEEINQISESIIISIDITVLHNFKFTSHEATTGLTLQSTYLVLIARAKQWEAIENKHPV
ncbi:hypothetical protein J437_LFUL012756 [Ladona fulva]|uniref:Endonuclease/exonuclease/phosphatase domain-containing protein n=1 Tax=Ladona fulva TaxID=123851 RepID=A0A8K0KRP4_LADFU|nr:hypothetical protein J437_LFUL012756 [Ladona fulva]